MQHNDYFGRYYWLNFIYDLEHGILDVLDQFLYHLSSLGDACAMKHENPYLYERIFTI